MVNTSPPPRSLCVFEAYDKSPRRRSPAGTLCCRVAQMYRCWTLTRELCCLQFGISYEQEVFARQQPSAKYADEVEDQDS